MLLFARVVNAALTLLVLWGAVRGIRLGGNYIPAPHPFIAFGSYTHSNITSYLTDTFKGYFISDTGAAALNPTTQQPNFGAHYSTSIEPTDKALFVSAVKMDIVFIESLDLDLADAKPNTVALTLDAISIDPATQSWNPDPFYRLWYCIGEEALFSNDATVAVIEVLASTSTVTLIETSSDLDPIISEAALTSISQLPVSEFAHELPKTVKEDKVIEHTDSDLEIAVSRSQLASSSRLGIISLMVSDLERNYTTVTTPYIDRAETDLKFVLNPHLHDSCREASNPEVCIATVFFMFGFLTWPLLHIMRAAIKLVVSISKKTIKPASTALVCLRRLLLALESFQFKHVLHKFADLRNNPGDIREASRISLILLRVGNKLKTARFDTITSMRKSSGHTTESSRGRLADTCSGNLQRGLDTASVGDKVFAQFMGSSSMTQFVMIILRKSFKIPMLANVNLEAKMKMLMNGVYACLSRNPTEKSIALVASDSSPGLTKKSDTKSSGLLVLSSSSSEFRRSSSSETCDWSSMTYDLSNSTNDADDEASVSNAGESTTLDSESSYSSAISEMPSHAGTSDMTSITLSPAHLCRTVIVYSPSPLLLNSTTGIVGSSPPSNERSAEQSDNTLMPVSTSELSGFVAWKAMQAQKFESFEKWKMRHVLDRAEETATAGVNTGL
ncbi:hypothetical protein EW145_g5007 [Phellinidium pouzarii]|uniref:Uncharacterized protein n=1 Tax=Phellinidium pouzarii TaxID=167371 RepID=A0A4S4L1G9_9AGAM|nr:hypothetical protein EW145_g5007 [Phellinidium pouzarii]